METQVEEALSILKQLGLPRGQQNERSALTLLALLDLRPNMPWSHASDPLRGVTPIMEFCSEVYGKTYAPNTRETIRRQTLHQFLDAGLVVVNPDQPDRAINSPNVVYQIEKSALELVRTFGSSDWHSNLNAYLDTVETLQERYAQEREMARIPVTVAPGKTISLSPGGQNVLVQQIIGEFAERFMPHGQILYLGDTDEKFAYYDKDGLVRLGVEIDSHGKMPDLIVYHSGLSNRQFF